MTPWHCSVATDPNPLLTAAQGAMRVADNVIVVSDGAVMLRPGFGTRYTKNTTYRPRAMAVFDGTLVIASRDGGTWRLENTSGTYTGEAEPLDPVLSPPQLSLWPRPTTWPSSCISTDSKSIWPWLGSV